MLKGSIALEVGDESVVRDYRFVAALGHNCEIVQVLKKLLVVADGQQDGGAVAVLVSELLESLAHGEETTLRPIDCRVRRAADPLNGVNNQRRPLPERRRFS